MSYNEEQYEQWEQKLKLVELPLWADLPKFELYMDQLVALVNETLGPIGIDKVTPAMINNYVKNKAIMAPVKKKYQTMQVADVILISLLKPAFSLETIRHGIDQVTANIYPQQAYDTFIKRLLFSFKNMDSRNSRALEEKNLNDKLMQVAVNVIIDRIQSEKLLSIIQKPLTKVTK
ncbi:DUF1836 domain-containing protein [Lentilactobacillus kefiri]|jgi:hypothetical protein|uniref:BS ykrK family protein n=2 Tax=Lentilactobacillus kefiri TaxID=33962 RepID=A0A8E1RK20_LENKE|nr:DUF1836 domain-containing protein [Lentilactobacillus kefiri]KRL75301.1 hypothetical protein FD08_GL002207 [Lentilactobacillus parakefiri DSM 10551]KRM53707.1 hypothetical protein FC95_GL000651 [Lentilactobacillus kefiri DSM 20587 = JCM 5818]MCJ2161642.1 DUF1836 domain-containing protein [Lentilactobacillus kefiri]MCP9369092.1 DUF1836 domain-containing protein [Lentilactobacillus kefiri]MDH5108389.1 DUF1836 domain-containing protein [Lentilactobacillus kefiri]